jgi:hypothetical protein
MIRILLSDDNEPFRQSCREIGAALGFEVSPFDDWENAQVELDAYFDQYHAVIIDGKGKLRDSTKAEDTKHLIEAIGWFREQRAKKRFIPVIVYTGFHPEIDSLTNTNDQVLKVFDKSKIKFEDVLKYIKTEVTKLPEQKFKTGFLEAYTFSQKYFSADNQKLIQELYNLTHRRSDDFIWKKSTFDALRRLNEALIDTIPGFFHSSPYSTTEYIEKVKRESSIKATAGNRTLSFIDYFHDNHLPVPDPIYFTIRSIYDTASKKYVHNESEDSDYTPSTEMILGLVYSHFGCYHWFNQIIKN